MNDKMASRTNVILIEPDDPCPCRSGLVTRECCMEPDGTFRVKFGTPLPSGPITEFSHVHCFMRESNNCSVDMSADPYMAKGVLDMFSAGAIRANFVWSDVARTTPVVLENLTSRLLCTRHNHALAPLDAVATRGFGSIFEATLYVIKKSLATKNICYAASGEGLELWVLKLLFGAHSALAADRGHALSDAKPLDFGIFQRALEGTALAAPCGLYLRRAIDNRAGMGSLVETAPAITGLRFSIAAFEFELIVDPAGIDFEAFRQLYYYRPSSIELVGRRRAASIYMSGPAFGKNEAARLELREARSG